MPNKYLDSVGLAEYTSLVKTALNGKATLDSPALTGTPTAPTPTAGDDSTKIATTEFVQDAIDAEETRADGAYLPLTGGSITGNLTVSGTITGDVTGDVTGTASGNLPLNGGTMTGTLYFDTLGEARIQNNTTNNDANVGIYGGQGYTNGAYLILNGKNRSNNGGAFGLYAKDENGVTNLSGKPDGTLTWGGKNVERVNSRGSNYIRYENGLQICFNRVSSVTTSGTAVTFPVAFVDIPRISAACATNAIAIAFSSLTATGCTFKTASGSQAIDYCAIGFWK